MALTRVTPPATAPITLAEAKEHLRVDHTDEDSLITLFIEEATSHLDGAEGILGRALITQTWDLFWDEFPTGPIKIPLPPLIDVTFIKYYDADAVLQTLDPSGYDVDTDSSDGWVVPSVDGWPATDGDTINAVQVRFIAGYGNAAQVPASIKGAILLMIGQLYWSRETTVDSAAVYETKAFDNLAGPRRRIAV